MPHAGERFIIVTGGPGAGKTTLLNALAAAGFPTAEETGRAIIKGQIAISGQALPWVDPVLYAEMMLSWEIASYRKHIAGGELCFFDRGIPDVIGYLRLLGLPVPAHMCNAAEMFRYHRRVFIAPPWPDIFVQDEERKQTVEEAAQTCDALAATYAELGYEPVEIPRCTVEARLSFVVDLVSG